MKKILYIFAAVALLLGVASCQKDKEENPEENITTQQAGVYNPGMKISRIYRQFEDGEKELEEIWHWNGNLLSRIDFVYDGRVSESMSYSYRGNRISRVYMNYDGYKKGLEPDSCIFKYSGDQLSTIDCYMDGKLETTFEYMYTNGKITTIYEGNRIHDYIWDGNNVVKDVWFSNLYSYDSHKNPFLGLIRNYENLGTNPSYEFLSENNVIQQQKYSKGSIQSFQCTYEYNSKGYPVKKISTNDWGSYTNTTTTYYEYLED